MNRHDAGDFEWWDDATSGRPEGIRSEEPGEEGREESFDAVRRDAGEGVRNGSHAQTFQFIAKNTRGSPTAGERFRSAATEGTL
ncbi:hypothetical protein DEQ92_17190 [Haloferax sp. Atlit-6N]|nr:hypothetical protein C5C07_17945 [Haloferax sp. Atlit-4N]REA01631.1 hypothetical protein DEQ92_17190 [Haloferax sp. Atlit-6N]